MDWSKNKLVNYLVEWLMKDLDTNEFPLCDFERIKYEIKPCDVLLVEGRNRISDIIKQATQSRWSHAGLYLGHLYDIDDPKLAQRISDHFDGEPRSQLVLESYLGKGTTVVPIEAYKNDNIRICRPRGLSRNDVENIICFVASHLGINYNIRQILDLGRYLLPWRIVPRKLGSSLFYHKTGKDSRICSTLIAEAFSSIKFPILPHVKRKQDKTLEFIRRNPRLITPSDFDYSPYFDIIKYPLFEISGHTVSTYRELPWHKDNVLSNDNEEFYVPDGSEYKLDEPDEAPPDNQPNDPPPKT